MYDSGERWPGGIPWSLRQPRASILRFPIGTPGKEGSTLSMAIASALMGVTILDWRGSVKPESPAAAAAPGDK